MYACAPAFWPRNRSSGDPSDVTRIQGTRSVRESARSDYRFSAVILSVVNSMPFQMRIKPEKTTINAELAERAGKNMASRRETLRSQRSRR